MGLYISFNSLLTLYKLSHITFSSNSLVKAIILKNLAFNSEKNWVVDWVLDPIPVRLETKCI